MTRYAEANKDLSFSFVDYRSNVATIDSTAAVTVVRNIGMANRMVTRVITVFNRDALGDQTLLNKYGSLGLDVDATGGATDGAVGNLSYNLRYNDRYEFATDVNNSARLFSLLTDSEGVPFLTKGEYCGNDAVLTANTFEGLRDDQNLSNNFFYISTRLTGGRVGSKGIEIHLNATDLRTANGPTSIRCYAEYLRVARLRNGILDIANA